jgi:oxygen-independent coproporphyrinogen-3 oxidase
MTSVAHPTLLQKLEEPNRHQFLTNYPPFRRWRPEAIDRFYEPRPLNLYLHVPYCIQRCAYCFYKVTTLGENRKAEIDRYVSALCSEIALVEQRFHLSEQPVKTIYFGGGTPTLLSRDNLSRIFEQLHRRFRLDQPEITVEAEPVTLTESKAEHLKSLGVNRISMGIQSFSDEIVARTGRSDTEADARKAIGLAKATAAVVNIDLMSGLAGDRDETWAYTLERAVESDVHSLTVYKTEVYANSAYYVDIKRKTLALPSDDAELRFTDQAITRFDKAGYFPVNFFTFTRGGGHVQQHATSSWRGRETYGFGTSAFGLLRGHALQNTSELPRYVSLIEEGKLPLARGHELTARELMTRDVALGMKLIHFDRKEFQRRHGFDVVALCGPTVQTLSNDGLVEVNHDTLSLTPKGLRWGDYVGHCLTAALESLMAPDSVPGPCTV